MKIHGTAKGGAISKKDFGVAFSASAIAPLEYTQTCTNNPTGMSGSYIRYGANLTNALFHSKTVTSVIFTIKNYDTTSTVNYTLYAYDENFANEEELDSVTQVMTTDYATVTFNDFSHTFGSNGGYLLFSYSDNNLQIGEADPSVTSSCDASSTDVVISRIHNNGTGSSLPSYPTISITN